MLIKCVTPPLWSSPGGVFSRLQGDHTGAVAATAVSLATVDDASDADERPQTVPPEPLAPKTTAVPPVRPSRLENLQAALELDRAQTTLADTTDTADRSELSNDDRPVTNAVRTSAVPVSPEDAVRTVLERNALTSVGAWIWAAGTVLISGIALVRFALCLRRLRRTQIEAGDVLEELVSDLRERLRIRATVRLLVSDSPLGPAVVGLWRPTIVLPAVVVRNKTREQLEPIIAHELLHVRRGDLWIGLLQTTVHALCWWHPLMWWASLAVTREAERCCDEAAIAELGCPPATYARSLLRVLELKQELKPIPAFPGVRPVDVTSNRLERIMKLGQGSCRRTPWWCWMVGLLVAVVVLPGAGYLAAGDEDEADSKRSAVGATNVGKVQSRRTKEPLPKDDSHKSANARLQTPITFDFDETPLKDAVKQISKQIGLNVVLDTRGLEEEAVTSKTPVTFEVVQPIAAGQALEIIARQLGLVLAIDGDVVEVTSRWRSQGKFRAVTHSVGDLVSQTVSFDDLTELIASTVEPDSWEEVGGRGSIRTFPRTLSLVVRQQEHVHQEISDLLGQLRRLSSLRVEFQALTYVVDRKTFDRLNVEWNKRSEILDARSLRVLRSALRDGDELGGGHGSKVNVANGESERLENLPADGKADAIWLQSVISADKRVVQVRLGLEEKQSKGAWRSVLTRTIPDRKTLLLDLTGELYDVPRLEREPILEKLPYTNRLFKDTGVQPGPDFKVLLLLTPRIVVEERSEKQSEEWTPTATQKRWLFIGKSADALREAAYRKRFTDGLKGLHEFDFDGIPLMDALKQIARQGDVNVVLDTRGLAETGMTSAAPVTFRPERPTSAKHAFEEVARQVGLVVTLDGNVVVLTSPARAQGKLKAVSYSVADLVVPLPSQHVTIDVRAFRESAMQGGGADIRKLQAALNPLPNATSPHRTHGGILRDGPPAQGVEFARPKGSHADFEPLSDLIQSTIAPESWKEVGGLGSIRTFDTTLSLVIRQTQDVHQQIRELLAQMRRLQDVQTVLELRTFRVDDKTASRLLVGWDARGALLHADESATLQKALAADEATVVTPGPKVTLFNGQSLELKNLTDDGGSLWISPILNKDARWLKLKTMLLNTQQRLDRESVRSHLVGSGRTLLIDVTDGVAGKRRVGVPIEGRVRVFKAVPPRDGKRVLVMITPKVIVQEEEEVLNRVLKE